MKKDIKCKMKKFITRIKQKIKRRRCKHEWKVFDSGYKQCKKCLTITK
jgi:hypothetical protein